MFQNRNNGLFPFLIYLTHLLITWPHGIKKTEIINSLFLQQCYFLFFQHTALLNRWKLNFNNYWIQTYQENPDAVGILVHIEAPEKNISWTAAVGYSDKKTKQAINAHQPALIASNTKTYMAVAIVKLVENW